MHIRRTLHEALHHHLSQFEFSDPFLCSADTGVGDEADAGGGSGAPPAEKSLLDFAKAVPPEDNQDEEAPPPPADDNARDRGDEGDETRDTLVFKDKPDWLRENFWNKETGEINLEGLAKSERDLRARMSRGDDKAPPDPEGYKFELADTEASLKEVEAQILINGKREDDPVFNWFREKAHSHKMPVAMADDLYKGYLGLMSEILPPQTSIADEVDRMGKGGPAIVHGITTFHQSLVDRGVLNEGEAGRVSDWFQTAEDFLAFQKIRDYYMDKAPPAGSSPPSGAKSSQELRAEMGKLLDRANNGDPTAAADYEKLMREYEATYGTQPAGSSPRG